MPNEKIERNNRLARDKANGMTYNQLVTKYSVSKGRIQQILTAHNKHFDLINNKITAKPTSNKLSPWRDTIPWVTSRERIEGWLQLICKGKMQLL